MYKSLPFTILMKNFLSRSRRHVYQDTKGQNTIDVLTTILDFVKLYYLQFYFRFSN